MPTKYRHGTGGNPTGNRRVGVGRRVGATVVGERAFGFGSRDNAETDDRVSRLESGSGGGCALTGTASRKQARSEGNGPRGVGALRRNGYSGSTFLSAPGCGIPPPSL